MMQEECEIKEETEHVKIAEVCSSKSCAMAQAVSRQSSHRGGPGSFPGQCTRGFGQSDTGTGIFPSSSVLPVDIIPPRISTLIYLGDKQYARYRPQFRDIDKNTQR
jgi:hypothetical protein